MLHPKSKNIFIVDDYFFFKLLTIALSLLLIALQVHHAFNVPMWRDDAFFASIAKNLANGEGYKAVFFDNTYSFHNGISAGPIIILPATLMMLIFGNQFWVPSLANTVLIWSLLIAIFTVSKDLLGKDKRWQFCFLALLLTLVFLMVDASYELGEFGSYGIETGDRLALWHLMMGEVPAGLCLILGAFLLFSPEINRKKIALGGLILGLGLLSKTLTAIASLGIIMMISRRILLEEKFQITRSKIISILIVISAFILPFCLFDLIKIIILGWPNYVAIQFQNAQMYENAMEIKSLWVKNFLALLLCAIFKTFKASAIAVMALTIYVIRRSAKISANEMHKNHFCHLAGTVMMFCFGLHLFWWCGFSHGVERYLVISLFYFFTALSLFIANIEKKSWEFKIVIIFVILLMLVERGSATKYLFFEGFKKNDRAQEQLMIRDIISDLQKKGVQMIACSNNFELEYLLPNTGNFQNCEESPQNFSKDQVMLVTYISFPVSNEIVSIRHDQYRGKIKPLPEFAKKLCPEIFQETKNFSLRWCKK
jgi:hypothetical protein